MNLQEVFSHTIASRALRQEAIKTLKAFDIIYGEFEILYLLISNKSLQPSEITSSLNCQPAAISRLVKTLNQRDFVDYSHDEDDRRQVFVSISEKGKKLIESIKDSC